MKKEQQLYIWLAFILLIFFTLTTSPIIFAKYVTTKSGTAYKFSFSSSTIVTDTFVISNPGGEKSGTLWGAGEDAKEYNSQYKVTNLANVQYKTFNATNEHMLIMFEIQIAVPGSDGTAYNGKMAFELNNTNNTTVSTPHLKADDISEKTFGTDIIYSENVIFTKIDYYLCTAKINPSLFSLSTDKLSCFILPPGEEGNYIIEIDTESLIESITSGGGFGQLVADYLTKSCYTSIKMIGHPCDETGKLYKVDTAGNIVVDSNGNYVYE